MLGIKMYYDCSWSWLTSSCNKQHSCIHLALPTCSGLPVVHAVYIHDEGMPHWETAPYQRLLNHAFTCRGHSPESTLKSEDLPQPLGPITSTERPTGTSNVSSRTSGVPSGALRATLQAHDPKFAKQKKPCGSLQTRGDLLR